MEIIKRIILTVLVIVLIRFGNFIPVANVNQSALLPFLKSSSSLNSFLTRDDFILSIFSLGIIPVVVEAEVEVVVVIVVVEVEVVVEAQHPVDACSHCWCGVV